MKLKELLEFYKSQKDIMVRNNKDIVIMSFNIRCISDQDTGNKFWKIRMPYIRKVLEDENPDIIGFQEVKVKQFSYLKRILRTFDYEYCKRDEKVDGEANPIFFKVDRFSAFAKKTFWLSATPDVMSNSFKGSCNRICSYVYLKEILTDKRFIIFNTHLDHKNEDARIKGIKLIKDTIKELNVQTVPHIIMGDMNDFYNSKTINELFNGYVDASKLKNDPNEYTFQDYGTKKEKIDYIALSKNINEIDYKVVTTKFGDIYPSDHYPIEVIIKL